MECCGSMCVISDYYTSICTTCGREIEIGISPSKNDVGTNAPLRISCYLRHKRFENHLDCVINPLHSTFPKSITLYHLQRVAPFRSMRMLINTLKTLTVAKSYTHLHLYSIKYLSTYHPPTFVPPCTRFDILRCFSKVEQRFISRDSRGAFFSYPWLLSKLLCLFGLEEYTCYVKNISCRKRNKKYEKLWKFLALDVMFEEFRVLLK